MPFDFRIVFSGICAFTPSPDGSFDEPKNRKGFFNMVTVVLPELITAGPVEGGGVRDGHIPTLELDLDQGWTGERKADLAVPSRSRKKDVFFLNKERVWFEFEGGDPLGIEVLNFDEVPPEGTTMPTTAEEGRYFWWVPKMERVAPGSENLLEDLLGDAFETVTALVELRQGRLSVAEQSISQNTVQFKALDGSGGEGFSQKIAFRIAVDVKQVTSVNILFQKRNEQGQRRTRNLSLQGLEGQVEIAVKNREIHELLGVPVRRGVDTRDVDFHAYYALSSRSDVPQLVPHDDLIPLPAGLVVMRLPSPAVEGQDLVVEGLSVGGVCPPTAFSGKASTTISVSQETRAPKLVKPRTVVATEKKAAKRVRRPY